LDRDGYLYFVDRKKEAIRRLDGLVRTIDKLIAPAEQETPRIRADLLRLEELRGALGRADP